MHSNGVPFTVAYFATTGDPLADIMEDMAAEQKARSVYENLIDIHIENYFIDKKLKFII